MATMMLPGVVTMIPGYVLMAKLRWIDTYLPFIVPAFFGGGAFNVFLVRQSMLAIPREMDEAARIDGANNATIFWRVLLPNCGPVLATVGVLSFVSTAVTVSWLTRGTRAWVLAGAGSFVARYGFVAVALGVPAYLGLWPALAMLAGFGGVFLAENVVLVPFALKMAGELGTGYGAGGSPAPVALSPRP